MTGKREFLNQLPIFRYFDESELSALSNVSQELVFTAGAVVAYQRDVADRMFIVRSGRLFSVSVDEHGVVRSSRSYLPGDYFGETWLFAEDAHPATVKAARDSQVIVIRSEDFLQFLRDHPDVMEALEPELEEDGSPLSGLSETAWREATKTPIRASKQSAAVNLLPDELVEYQARRSVLYLVLTIFLPLMGFLVLPALVYYLLNIRTNGAGLGSSLALPLAGLVAIVFAGIVLFLVLDWSNDYFVITNKHMVHREFSLRTFRINVNKIPLHQIQSVEIAKPNLIATLLNVGTARITTAAQVGTVLFDNIDDPVLVKEAIERLSQRVRALDAGREQATMRQSIEEHFQLPAPYEVLEDEEGDGLSYVPATVRRAGFWSNFFRRYQGRVEEGNRITYRKHIFVLLREVAWPLGLGIAMVVMIYVLFVTLDISLIPFGAVLLVLLLVDLGWFIWQMEDWRNDTFQLTPGLVVDIDRRPFGFGESRKQAPLSNIQNVNASRPGLLPTIFNYGNVEIETAGATADLTFEDVSNPSRIQSDIFKALDQYRRQQNIKAGAERRKEYAVLVDVFKQATEQERIPRRTPTEFHEEDEL